MDRPVVHRSSLPHSWSQPYPHSGPPTHNYPHPLAPQYPHDQYDPYPAPTLYPTVVSQQMPHRNSHPLPNSLIPGGNAAHPRRKSFVGGNPYVEQQAPPFPSPSTPHFPQAHPFPHIPVPPAKPPALQAQLSEYSFPTPTPGQAPDMVPIRPSPVFARRSSSSPAIGRTPVPDAPPPVPPLPPNYHLNNHQHIPPRVSPAPPPSIPIPSPHNSYRSDSSALYDSPYEAPPPPFSVPPQPRISSPPQFPTSSPPNFEGDVKHAPVDDETEALKMALALSKKESMAHSAQEQLDLEKAIEESIKHASSFGISISPTDAGPSTFPKTTSPSSFPSPLPVSEPSASRPQNTPHVSQPASKKSSPLLRPAQPAISDEALAQQLADQEELAASAGPSNPKPPSPVFPSPKPETTTPTSNGPRPSSRGRREPNQSKFAVVNVDSDISPASRKRQEANQSKFNVVNSDSGPPPPQYSQVVSAHMSASANTSPTLPNKNPPFGRSTSASAVTPSSSRPSPIYDPADASNVGRSQSVDTGLGNSNAPPISTNPTPLQSVQESPVSPVQSPSSSTGPAVPNSFIDQRLLNGVSLGFNPPQITSIKTTLKGGVPNVISLPTGKFVPFHIQAPDWRHLLKMMARLSGSRIEASVEALAATKQELKLRTIVQFVKVNATSQDWRTVIYLTIDHPPPSNAPHKFTNGDVNTLPFSYAASSLPALLRDGPDGPMSKYYTIPATPNTPHPTLPISFPNMAMYLASAVEDSRRMARDNSSGMKRLAKTLDFLYPAQVELGMEDDEPDRPTGVVNMFRNVFGRGRGGDQRRNDDNYADLVTPFLPEWG